MTDPTKKEIDELVEKAAKRVFEIQQNVFKQHDNLTSEMESGEIDEGRKNLIKYKIDFIEEQEKILDEKNKLIRMKEEEIRQLEKSFKNQEYDFVYRKIQEYKQQLGKIQYGSSNYGSGHTGQDSNASRHGKQLGYFLDRTGSSYMPDVRHSRDRHIINDSPIKKHNLRYGSRLNSSSRPMQYKTKICPNVNICVSHNCTYAHYYDELRCRSFSFDRSCVKGSRCMFRHNNNNY